MKKILCVCFMLFSLSVIIAACKSNTHQESDGIEKVESDINEEISVQFLPISFEEALARSSQVFLGKVTSKHVDGANSYVIMIVEKAFYGIEEGVEVKVSLDARVADLRMYLTAGEEETLLVLLQKNVSVLEDEDHYIPSYYCFIPIMHLEAARFAGGMFGSMFSLAERDQILDACEKYAGSEGKTYYGREFIRSSHLHAIIEGSENIVCVKICSELLPGGASDRKTLRCEVTKSLKGGLEEGKVFSITLRNDWGLEIGGEYIIAVEFYENSEILGDYYGLTSKTSFWSLDREQAIMEWIH